jgi:hypothetical protein
MTFRSVFTILAFLLSLVRFGSAFHISRSSQQRLQKAGCLHMNHDGIAKKFVHSLATGFLALNVMTADGKIARADDASFPNVPVYNKKSSDLIPYVNVERGE